MFLCGIQAPRINTIMKRNIIENPMSCTTCSTELTGKQKLYCSRKCHNASGNVRLQNYQAQQERGLHRKRILIEMCGGKCSQCGYDRNYAALCFHHLRDKSFQLDIRKCSNSSMERLIEEVAKCVLLCANCHMEVHHPDCGGPART